jgi:DNA modification methylase
MPKRAGGFWTLHRHDARKIGMLLESNAEGRSRDITATITSPPYGALKDYGHKDQIGFGHAYDAYLAEMEAVFRQIYERTAADGSLWLIADTYMSKGAPPRRLLPVPFDLAASAEAAGFILRDVIIWEKDRTLPWSNGTRLRNAFEYVLLLVKGGEPKYEADRLRGHEELKGWWPRFPERYNPNGKAPSNVWRFPIPKQGSWAGGEIAHACPLPPELVERLILLSSDEGDVILDPFAGSGVVVAEAERLGRLGLGAELVKRHVEEFARIIRPEILARREVSSQNGDSLEASAELLVKLRMLKLPVVLMRAAARRRSEISWPLGVMVLPVSRNATAGRHGVVRLIFFVAANAARRRDYASTLRELAARAPASKFGLDAEIEVLRPSELKKLARGRRIYNYRNGTTSRATGTIPHGDLRSSLEEAAGDVTPPVLSSIHVDVAPRSEAGLRVKSGQAASSTS